MADFEKSDDDLLEEVRRHFSRHPEQLPDDAFEILDNLQQQLPETGYSKEEIDRMRSSFFEKFGADLDADRAQPVKMRKSKWNYRWAIGMSVAATIAICAVGLYVVNKPSGELVALASVVNTTHRGGEGTGIEVLSPQSGYVYVVLVDQDGSPIIEPGPSREIQIVANEKVVVEVQPDLARNTPSDKVRVLTFVTPIAKSRVVIANTASKVDLTSADAADDIVKELLANGNRWVASGEASIQEE